jgi:hypothetical protein
MRNKDLQLLSEAYAKIYTENHGHIIRLMDELPDGSNAMTAIFHFKEYISGQNTHMYGVQSSGKINVLNLPSLVGEIEEAKKIAEQQGELDVASDFEDLLKELEKIENKYQYIFDQEDTEDQTQSQI